MAGGTHTHRAPLAALCVFCLVTGGAPAVAVDVWLTTGDRSSLLDQQQDLIFEPGNGSGGFTITVDPSTTYQTIDGFGASLTDSSAWLIENELNSSQRDKLMNLLFDPESGVGLSYLRQPMGSPDFTASGFYTYNDLPPGQTDVSQSQFSIAHDQQYIIPQLLQAQAINPDLSIMASPWSAPAWMKTNGSLIGGQLQSQYHASYARYFRKFIEAYAAEGLEIDAVTLQNEPLFSPSNYPGMTMSSAQQGDIIKNHLGPEFQAAGINTDIVLYDHNWDVTSYAIDQLNDPGVKQYVAGTAFHGYAGDVSAQSTVHNAHPDRGVYFTEISGGDFAPNFSDNLVFGVENIIIGNTRNWGKTAVYWNLALDQNNGPHLGGCSDCRGVVTIDTGSGDVTLNEEYYTLAHASKFVQPGAARIDSRTINGVVETVAFENPDGSRALIALNPGNATRDFRIVEGGEHVAYSLPGKSVATFTWPTRNADFDNGGFEQLGGSTQGWIDFGNAAGNVEASEEHVLSGDYALELFGQSNGPNNFSGVSQGMSVEAGDVVRATASTFIDSLDSLAGTGNEVVMKIEFFDEFGGQFGTPDLIEEHQITIADALSANDAWQDHSLERTAPAGAKEARLVFFFFQPSFESGSVFVDASSIELVTNPLSDLDLDADVDVADLLAIQRSGDAQALADWELNFGSGAQTLAAATAVPEPASVVAAIACLAFVVAARFSRN
ncbi:MAG: glycoside hydrolase family 30 beta sandwich domain-containing protein [Planctomycetota bacterium]